MNLGNTCYINASLQAILHIFRAFNLLSNHRCKFLKHAHHNGDLCPLNHIDYLLDLYFEDENIEKVIEPRALVKFASSNFHFKMYQKFMGIMQFFCPFY